MPTLADAIISENENAVRDVLRYGAEVNELDEYGFTPLIEAAIANHLGITELLLQHGALVNLQDMLGNTALHWAAENNNIKIAELLLSQGANPNLFSLSGQPVLTMPVLRNQQAMKDLLIARGADLEFAKDFIHTKFIGHLFELVGVGCIISPDNQIVEVDFEGFFPEVTLSMITDSLVQFRYHYVARRLRRYDALMQGMIDAISHAAQLVRFQQGQVDRDKYQTQIKQLIAQDPLVIPVGYEGHAITFIRYRDLLVKCDRREDSRVFDNIVIYQVGRPTRLNSDYIQKLIYTSQSFSSVNEFLPVFLDLKMVTTIKIPPQVSGNCSWANVEACIPALFFLLAEQYIDISNINLVKNQALQFFNDWREWNKERSLQFFLQRFHQMDVLRQASQAEILAAILFQCCAAGTQPENEKAERIIAVLKDSPCRYVLKNYVRSYAFEDMGFEGQRFMRLLRDHGFDPRTM